MCIGFRLNVSLLLLQIRGNAWAQLVQGLRYKPEVAGSIPDGVIGIFH
jgi:hypothetical protein